MKNIAKVPIDKTTFVKDYPLDFLIIGPQEDDQLGIILQSSSDDIEHYDFNSNSILSDLQRRVTQWNKYGSGNIDISQHIVDQYAGHVYGKSTDAARLTTTVKSGQPLSIKVEAYDDYFYVWHGKVSAVDRNKIQKEFTQRIPDIVKSLEQDDDDQIMQHLDPIVTMSMDFTESFAKRARQIRVARVIFISLAVLLFLIYVTFRP